MLQRGQGSIIYVASIAGYQTIPVIIANYFALKKTVDGNTKQRF